MQTSVSPVSRNGSLWARARNGRTSGIEAHFGRAYQLITGRVFGPEMSLVAARKCGRPLNVLHHEGAYPLQPKSHQNLINVGAVGQLEGAFVYAILLEAQSFI